MKSLDRKIWNKNKVRVGVLPDGTLQVTAPSDYDIGPFLKQKRGWIEKQIHERECITCTQPGGDDLFLFQGTRYQLTHGSNCSVSEDVITYTTPKALKEMILALLKKEVEEQVDNYSPQLGCSVKSISIRTQKSRWGSCSGKGNLNFNLAIMALPLSLRKYIILHEIVHLVERNHAPRFWNRLGALHPDYQNDRKELKKFWILVERNTIWRVLRNG